MPEFPTASRLWHVSFLILVGAVLFGTELNADALRGGLVIGGAMLLVPAYVGLAWSPLARGASPSILLGAALAGSAVMMAAAPGAVMLLLGIIPQLFRFAPIAVAGLATASLSAVAAISTLAHRGPEATEMAVAIVVAGAISIAAGVWLSHVFYYQLRLRETIAELERSRQRVEELARVAGAAEERAQIGQDVHDGMAQQLTAVQLLLRQADTDTGDQDSDRARERIRLAQQQCEQAIAECRFLIGQQSILGDEDLPSMVRQLSRLFESTSGVPTQVNIPAEVPEASATSQLVLRRTLTEALSNCSRHAHATQIDVHLALDNDTLTLQVIDDGRGFNTTDILRPQGTHLSGYGLPGLAERLSRLNGNLNLISSPGEGTTLRATLPALGTLTFTSDQPDLASTPTQQGDQSHANTSAVGVNR